MVHLLAFSMAINRITWSEFGTVVVKMGTVSCESLLKNRVGNALRNKYSRMNFNASLSSQDGQHL